MLAKQFKFCTIPTLQMGTQVWREAVCQAHGQGQQHSPKELQIPEQLAHIGGVAQQCPLLSRLLQSSTPFYEGK